MRRFCWILVLFALAGFITVTATASKDRAPKANGTVIGVPAGDFLTVRLVDGKIARVRILGVRAPTGSSCYARESAAAIRSLTQGKRVTLVGDLAKGAYVTLPDVADLGRTLLGRGVVQIDAAATFSRVSAYAPVQESAERGGVGMWGACAADVSVAVAGPEKAFPGDYVKYTVTVSNAGPLTAPQVQLELRPGNYAKQIVSVTPGSPTCESKGWVAYCSIQLGARTSTSLELVIRPNQAGALSARAVASIVGCASAQCGMAPLQDPNLANDRAAAATIVPGGVYGLPGKECDPSYPTVCLPPPPPDLDCEDFNARHFAVRRDVAEPDPHHLDGNGDGIACEGDDY